MSVSTYLDDLASQLIITVTERNEIDARLESLAKKLKDHFGADIKSMGTFGSYPRKTLMPRKADPRSDIDVMIVFRRDAGQKPSAFLSRLKHFALAKYPRKEIYQDHPTIVLELNNILIELVPAYTAFWGGCNIPAPHQDFSLWMGTSPNDINKRLTDKNKSNSGKIRPLIRILKYWNALNKYPYASYDLEKRVIHKTYYSCLTIKDYLYSFILSRDVEEVPAAMREKLARAQTIIERCKSLEAVGQTAQAEKEIKKLLPPYK